MSIKPITIMIMSGVEDGTTIELNPKADGTIQEDNWIITVGRKDDNDLCLRKDTFVSRYHAKLQFRDGKWWLEDLRSTNGSFIEDETDAFVENRFEGIIPLEAGKLFRLGRTWLRIQPAN